MPKPTVAHGSNVAANRIRAYVQDAILDEHMGNNSYTRNHLNENIIQTIMSWESDDKEVKQIQELIIESYRLLEIDL